jgi:hypothetical protein
VGELHGIEVFPLNVFDNCEFETIGRGDIREDRRQRLAIRELASAEPALTHDQLVSTPSAAQHDWLQHSVLADGIRESTKGFGFKFSPRLIWIRIDQSEFDL